MSVRVKVLLVDDQAMVGEAVRRMLAAETDIDYLYCGDPAKAIETAVEFGATVILQDLVMPDIDGLTMLKFFRANSATRDIPTIVLSTKEEPKTKAEAFSLGANDYLVKLPDPIELIARVRAHSRGYIAQIERNQAYAALKVSEERLASELESAAKYVMSLLPERLTGEIRMDWQFIPSVELGGDTFGYHWLDDDHFAMYLLDVCGHGLRAALLSISAMNVVHKQALPATDFRSPSQVLASLNDAFQMEQHDGMYFTMWYGVYNKTRRQLTLANAGHPPVILLAGASAATAQVVTLSKPGLMIGAFPGTKFIEMVYDLPASCRLYIFSDGVYEITRPDDSMLTFPEFVDILAAGGKNGASVIDDTIAAIRAVRGGAPFEDDVSMVEVIL